jgi:hypothetical protein
VKRSHALAVGRRGAAVLDARAVGEHRQARRKRALALLRLHHGGAAIEAGEPGAEQEPGRAGRGEQASLQLVVAGDVAQRGQVAIGGADQGAAKAALL